jgi:hypothetical protein
MRAVIEFEKLVVEGGRIVAPVYFEDDFHHFPEVGWWDCPQIILEWWLTALNDRAEAMFDFMEGPYQLVAVRDGANATFSGVRRGASGDTILFRAVGRWSEFEQSIQDIACRLEKFRVGDVS